MVRRRAARLAPIFFSMVEITETGWSGSIACTSRFTAAARVSGSPDATRTSKVTSSFETCGNGK